YFQLARASIPPNIPSAWRRSGLKPFQPNLVLQQLRPQTPPTATFTDENGVTISIIATQQDLAAKINDIVAQLQTSTATPVRLDLAFLQQTCLMAIADRNTLQLLNESLVKKAQEARLRKARKAVGDARVLTVQEIVEKNTKREETEALRIAE